MKLTLLGTGTPWPSAERQGTASLVEMEGANILIDAGRGAAVQLARIGMHPRDIDYVFITHHHFDHIASLDDLLLSAWNDGRTRPVHVFGPDGTRAIIDHMFNGIYARDIMFRMKEAEHLDYDLPDIRELVRVEDMTPGDCYKTDNWSVCSAGVEHGRGLGLEHEDWPCFGYRLSSGGKVLAFSGDAIDCEGVRTLAKHADLLVQCCYLAEAEVTTPNKRILSDLVLGSAAQANRVARAAGVKRMVLTHLAPKSDEMLEAVLAEAKAGLEAEVLIGADLMQLAV